MLINYTNHAVNLILYIATSSNFRDEIKEFFCDLKKKLCSIKDKNKKTDLVQIEERSSLTKAKARYAVQL
jgi:hypothetical protein